MTAAAAVSVDRVCAPAAPRGAGWRSWLPAALIAWLVFEALFLALNHSAIGAGAFHDPDDELRLVQVRDLLGGQGWFDPVQHRIAAASGGVAMHWSRLVDAPLAALILLLRPLLGQAGAEQAALIAIPALTLLALFALSSWMASRTLPARERPFALIALGCAVAAMVQVQPLRIDHHGWQIVLALAAVAAFLDPAARRGGWLTGAALAAWMAVSFEGLPFSAWLIAVLAGWTLIDRALLPRLVSVMQALAGFSLALFIATRGIGDLAAHCDAIAPLHLAMFAWGAAAITVTGMLWPHRRLVLIAGFAIAGGGALASLLAAAPQCAAGSFDMLDPLVRNYWYDNVREGKPLWHADLAVSVQYLVPPLIGLWASLTLARRGPASLRACWLFYAATLAGAIGLALLVTRSAAFAAALAALPLGSQLAAWLGALRRPERPLLRIGELAGVAALIFCALFPAVPALAARGMLGLDRERQTTAPAPASCSVRAAALDALPAGDILAPLDLGPGVLLHSAKGVLATGHHRGAPAMRRLIEAFTGSPDRARAIMRAHGLRYVIVCPGMEELALYGKRAPAGFAAQLAGGSVPSWLKPVPLPREAGLRMWEILP